MTKQLKLTKIVLETKDGKTVELSMDEAKELHSQLDSLFGDKTTYIPSPYIIERDRWYPPYPIIWGDTSQYNREILCSSAGSSGLSVSYCGEQNG